MEIAAVPFPASFQKRSDSEQVPWTVFSSLWRCGSTRNQRINRFPATVLALLLYICLWRWKLAAPEQLSAWTIGTDHVIIAACIFSSWVAYNLFARIAGGFPSLYEWERAPPVRPVLCEQNWMLSLSLRYYKCALFSVCGHRPAET